MSGLLRRLTRRGPATADENRSPTIESSDPAAAPADAPAEPGGERPVGEEPATQILPATTEPAAAAQPDPEQPTAFAAQHPPARDLPAGVDPADLEAITPASARRGKLRRRLRYLRTVRLLLLRDLGGFTYEIHRTAGGTAQEPHRRLAAAKAERIAAIDAEVASLERRLGEAHAAAVVREPGIGGTCRECGELHASDAHFCSRCGEPLDEKARTKRNAAIAAAAKPAPSQTAAEAPPASVLWAGATKREQPAEPESEVPGPITTEWLTTGGSATSGREEPQAGPQPTTFERPEPEEPKANPWVAATTPADEPTRVDPVADEPTLLEPAAKAKPKPRRPRKPKPAPEPFEANGRRDEDVPAPEPDPAVPPREQP